MMLSDHNRAQTVFNRETMYLIFRNKSLVFLIFAGTMFLSVLIHYHTPPKYEASAKVLVKLGREKSADRLMEQNESFYNTSLKSEDINTEIEIIKSPDLLKVLAQRMGVSQFLGRDTTGDPERDVQRAVDTLQKRLDVEQVINTNVIEIRFYATHPKTAAEVVNSLIDLYMDKHIDLHSVKGVRELIERQAEIAKADLERIERKLEQYYAGSNQENQGYSSPRSSRVFRTEASESIGFMEKRLLELEFEKKKLLNQYRRDSQPVKDIKNQIDEINQMLIQERKKYGWQEKEFAELERQRTIAEERNMLYLKKLDEARIMEAMDQHKIVSVTLLTRANPPLRPKGAGLMMSVLFGFGLAGIFSALFLLIRHTMDDTFYEETRVERLLKLPVVACIPFMGRMEGDERERPAKKTALPSST